MSAISEAKEQFASASEAADEAMKAAAAVTSAIADAVVSLNEAASGSKHEKVEEALTSYLAATASIEATLELISAAQSAADEYASGLG